MIKDGEIQRAADEYQDSLALPSWDNKTVHRIDFLKGVHWALERVCVELEKLKELKRQEQERLTATSQKITKEV